MNVDGSNLTNFTDGVGLNFDPMYVSLGGTELLVFSSNRDNLTVGDNTGFELYSMKTDGSGITRLTNNTTFDAFCIYWYNMMHTLTRTASQQRMPSVSHHTGNVRW